MNEIRPRNWEEITRIMAEARCEQSRHLMAGVRWVGRALTTLARAAGAAFANAQRRNTVHHVLSQMTDRELRDIGLSRVDIPAVVAGVWTRETEFATAKVATLTDAGQRRAPSPVAADQAELRKAA